MINMIKVLEKNIADKIAAGEVIERPVSIVKELVENSIDAGASSIVVEIKNGGKSYIRVTDDGCGIPKEQVATAFLRHATSKISQVRDLNSIETLGFRGEALASIGAVTRTEILTKCFGSKAGYRLVLHGGETLLAESTGCPEGTTFVVTDLFYNTPARLKFMKSDSAESGLIIDFMSQIALAYKDICFRLINNGNILFSTLGDGNRLATIQRVYKSADTANLVAVNHSEGELKLEGYISTPVQSKSTRSSQIFFVNGRVVNSKVIERGLEDGYKERLFDKRYPVAFLFLEVNPGDLDVNIHPNKKEIRFDREGEVAAFISRAIKEALGTKEAVVRAANIFKEKPAASHDTGIIEQINKQEEKQVDIKQILSTINNIEKTTEKNYEFLEKDIQAVSVVNEEVSWPVEQSGCQEQTIGLESPHLKPFDFDSIAVTGSIFGTYITATDENSFYLIDQHAAHERIFYERLVGQYDSEDKVKQPIMVPLMINVSLSADENRFSWLSALEKMGFTIDEFGQNTYRVSEIPMFMELTEAEKFINDFVEEIKESTDLKNTVVIDKLIMKSCKSAVKANDYLKADELTALINDLKSCVNPFSCPHGRPTFIKLTKYEIERLFKRIQ